MEEEEGVAAEGVAVGEAADVVVSFSVLALVPAIFAWVLD